jgi:membrane fusion protein (multidrug efflux system)
VQTVSKRDLPLFLEAVGSLDGYVNADLRARVRGVLAGQHYKDGAQVKQGQLLFTLEPAEYATALASAKAGVARAEAAQSRNRTQFERAKGLIQSGMTSQQELDNAQAAAADADAQVESAKAALEQARLSLSYTQIHAPLAGVAGVALVRAGNLVGQDGPTLLATVSQLDPVRVNFPLSEVDYVRHPERFHKLDERDLAWAKKQFTRLDQTGVTEGGDPGLQLLLSDGSLYPHKGVVVSVNRQIDASTGTIQVQALIPNPTGALRPGQYARVRLQEEGAGQGVIAVPEKALISVQGTYSVAVVGEGNKVSLRKVEVGAAAQGLRIIEKGLQEGERIVVEGLQKVSDGAVVDAKPQPVPAAVAGEPGRSTTAKP